MFIRKTAGPVSVKLADGSILCRSDLPSPETKRWVIRRKAVVVAAVQGGLIERKEAQELYHLSDEELDSWCKAVESHGKSGLKVTSLQLHRQS